MKITLTDRVDIAKRIADELYGYSRDRATERARWMLVLKVHGELLTAIAEEINTLYDKRLAEALNMVKGSTSA